MNFIRSLITSLLLIPFALYSSGLNTLSDFIELTKNLPPIVQEDDFSSSINPSFSNFYQQNQSNYFMNLMRKTGFYNDPIFDPAQFKSLLGYVTKTRVEQGLQGSIVRKITSNKPLKFFIWGDVEGALHSLVRCLEYLSHQGIIDDSLKIQNKHHYFVFNGDAIDRSPYDLETLQLILLLMKKNPRNVIYIRGQHETNDYWHNFSLKQALKAKASSVDSAVLPLGNMVSAFFKTLPAALYLHTEKDPMNVIRISHFGRNKGDIDETKFGSFFLTELSKSNSYLHLEKAIPSSQRVDVKVIIKTEEWMKENRASDGLGFLDQDLGASAWAVLSSPRKTTVDVFDLYFDAFAVLDFDNPVEKSTITLINRDIRTKDPFKKDIPHNIISGAPISTESDKNIPNTLVVGSTLPLERGLPIMAERVKRGLDISVNQTNLSGLFGKKHVRLFMLNDDYIPFRARQNVEYLIKNNIRTLLLPIGTPTLLAYIDLVKKGEISVFFPVNGGSEFQSADLKNMILLRPTYDDEVRVLIDHVVSQYSVRKIAFFYQNDSYGLGPLKAAQDKLKELGITEWIEIPYNRASTNFEKQAQQLKQEQLDAICLLSVGNATQELFRQVGFEFLSTRVIFGISPLNEESFKRYVRKHGLEVVFSSIVPNPRRSQLEIVRDYRDSMNRNHYSYDVYSLEGYIATNLFLHAVEQVKGEITREKIMAIFEGFQNYTYKGLQLTFNPLTRSLGSTIWIETGENTDWIEMKVTRKAGQES